MFCIGFKFYLYKLLQLVVYLLIDKLQLGYNSKFAVKIYELDAQLSANNEILIPGEKSKYENVSSLL